MKSKNALQGKSTQADEILYQERLAQRRREAMLANPQINS